jgi:macrodomain Ter protein organizer (MatP/YcbG family)
MAEHINDTVNKIKLGLAQVADAIETIANRETPPPNFNNNEISGDKVHGGTISKFSSVGIADEATKRVMHINDNGVSVTNLVTKHISSSPTVYGDLTVEGLITAQKLHVNELTADVRNERSTPLEFVADDNGIYGKGLQWRGQGPTKQFIYRANPDRLYSTESIDIATDASYSIGNVIVLSGNDLGNSIRNSNLVKVGTLQNLRTQGNLTIDDYIIYDSNSQRLGFGTENPNASISVTSLESEFIIDVESETTKIGNWTTSDLQIVTDNTARITVRANGKIEFGKSNKNDAKVSVFGKLGVGINNVSDDVSFATASGIEIAGTKIMTGTSVPDSGIFRQGDIVYNKNAVATGYIGWVCVRDGTPGTWKAFGQISS